MRVHVLGALALVLASSTAVLIPAMAEEAPNTPSNICNDPSLPAAEQTTCRDRLSAATTTSERDQIRRDYAPRTASAHGVEPLPAGLPPTTSPPPLPDAASTPTVPRTPGTASTYDPATKTVTRPPQ